MNNPLTVALPKGRLENDALKILKTANYGTNIDPKSRQLIFDDEAANIRYLIVNPSMSLPMLQKALRMWVLLVEIIF